MKVKELMTRYIGTKVLVESWETYHAKGTPEFINQDGYLKNLEVKWIDTMLDHHGNVILIVGVDL